MFYALIGIIHIYFYIVMVEDIILAIDNCELCAFFVSIDFYY